MSGLRERYDSDEDFEMKDEDVKWKGKGVLEKGQVLYSGVTLDGSLELHQGDTVLVKQSNPQVKHRVATIRKLFYESHIGAYVHLEYFCSAEETFLGEKADPREFFFTDECGNVPLKQIWDKCTVERRSDSSPSVDETLKPGDFFASYWYDGGQGHKLPQIPVPRPVFPRFEKIQAPVKIPDDQDAFLSFCEACARKTEKEVAKVVRVKKGKLTSIIWMGEVLRKGD